MRRSARAAVAIGCAMTLSTAVLPVCSRAAAAAPAGTSGVEAGSGALDEIMALLARRRHDEADFQELKYVAVLQRPIESSGVLVYDAPDHLEERILQPRAQTAVLDHGQLTLRIGQRERSVSLADYPQLAPVIDSIRALLAGDQAGLARWFKLEFSGTLDHWQLRLEPRTARLAATLVAIEISGERDAVRIVQLRATNGDHSIMHLQPRP